MSSDKNGIGTNKKVVELYGMMNDGSLILQPSFQRKLVWNDVHKEKFLETIIFGYPFPEVYFADGDIDLEKKKSTTLVVDGQQRLHTIYQYITNDSKLILKKVKRYNELTQKEQTDFLDYKVVVRDLGRIREDEIKEIFSRINSVQYALNAMEIDNALYEGEFISVAKSIQSSNLLTDLQLLTDGEISRMKDLEFILLIMSTVEVGGYFTSNNEVDTYIKRYDNDYPNKDYMVNKFLEVLSYVKQLNLPVDSIWYRKTCMFSLLSELLMRIYTEKKTLPNIANCYSVLIDIENKIISAKDEGISNQYADFYSYMFQGTSSRKGRNVRGIVIKELFEEQNINNCYK